MCYCISILTTIVYITGYECYSPMAGIELPMKCYNSQWVKEQKEYWANCSPPDCYFPA